MGQEKLKKANEALNLINKHYGQGTIVRLGNDHNRRKDIEYISTGSLGLDFILGGGMPKGRIIEIFGAESSGKTTIALHIIAEAQKLGGQVAFIDAEHALDVSYAKALGVDTDNLPICQPDHSEMALNITETLVRQNCFDVIVVDSVAALVPQKELEGEVGDSFVGLQPRLMSQMLRKVAGVTSKSNCILIFINQLREKVGVVYGCFHGDTLVTFADGKMVPISKVVKEKISEPVLSFNQETGSFEYKKIINWFNNGKLQLDMGETWYNFIISSSDGRVGRMGFTCTPNHKILNSNYEYVSAKSLKIGDKLISWYESKIENNNIYKDIVYGSLLGSGSIRIRDKSTGCFSLANGEQKEYLSWKLEKLKNMGFKKVGNKRIKYDSDFTSEIGLLKSKFYIENMGYRTIPDDLELSPLMVAVWYMDDGHYKKTHRNASISIKRLFIGDNVEKIDSIKSKLINFIGCKESDVFIKQKSIQINTDAFKVFSKKISAYVPECMQYKLPPEHRGKYIEFNSGNLDNISILPCEVKILSIDKTSKRKLRNKNKYDIQIEGTSSYLVGGGNRGIVVHNSPEITTGGRALRFYSSVRLDIRTKERLKQGGEVYGNMVAITTVKNKIHPPYKKTELEIVYGQGINKVGELVDFGVITGVINKAGAWYSYGDEKIGQGRNNVIEFLKQNPDIAVEVEKQIKIKLGMI